MIRSVYYKVVTAWYRSAWLFIPLWPLSWLFSILVRLRYYGFRLGLFRPLKQTCPVIVVGNIEVGGSGKTPVVIALAKHLSAKGYKPGIISRGYGRRDKTLQWVSEQTSYVDVGDEPLMIWRQTRCPVVVCRYRVNAVQALIEQTDCNVILSDDGLQHYAMARDVEIVLEYVSEKCRNQQLLPAGPYREPRKRLQLADFHWQHGAKHHDIVLAMGQPYEIQNPSNVMTWSALKGMSVIALAGIAKPERFFDGLRQHEITVHEHALPDHSQCSILILQQLAAEHVVIMTEKDAVKYQLGNSLTGFKNQILVVPLQADIDQGVLASFDQRAAQLNVKNDQSVPA